MFEKIKEKNTRVAVTCSLMFHVIVLLIFLLIKLNWKLSVSDFTEITFIGGGNQFASTSAMNKIDASETKASTNEGTTISALVELPARRMLEPEPSRLTVPNQARHVPSEKLLLLAHEATPDQNKEHYGALFNDSTGDRNKITSLSSAISTNEQVVTSITAGLDSSELTPYQIEGQAASRKVIYKVIPEYPEHLQEQAMVKISFTILPNGQIGEMGLLIKSEAQLEQLTLESFRQWRFNPLPPEQSQRIEHGVIIFRYLLK